MWTQGLVILHYAVALAVSVRVLLRPRLEPTVRLSWILVIELVPLVGIIAYVLFGEIRLRGAEVETMANVRSRLSGLWKPSPEAVRDPAEPEASVIAANRATTGFLAVAGNCATLLPEDDSAMTDEPNSPQLYLITPVGAVASTVGPLLADVMDRFPVACLRIPGAGSEEDLGRICDLAREIDRKSVV